MAAVIVASSPSTMKARTARGKSVWVLFFGTATSGKRLSVHVETEILHCAHAQQWIE